MTEREIGLRARFAVDDGVLSSLHARAFGGPPPAEPVPWTERLNRYALTWAGAFAGDRLVGFVQACTDGGAHAFLLDTVVDPAEQRRGIGRALVERVVAEATDAGCTWLHVDFEPGLAAFYRACGFGSTEAGLRRLGGSSSR